MGGMAYKKYGWIGEQKVVFRYRWRVSKRKEKLLYRLISWKHCCSDEPDQKARAIGDMSASKAKQCGVGVCCISYKSLQRHDEIMDHAKFVELRYYN